MIKNFSYTETQSVEVERGIEIDVQKEWKYDPKRDTYVSTIVYKNKKIHGHEERIELASRVKVENPPKRVLEAIKEKMEERKEQLRGELEELTDNE